jgi:hypothetical protein
MDEWETVWGLGWHNETDPAILFEEWPIILYEEVYASGDSVFKIGIDLPQWWFTHYLALKTGAAADVVSIDIDARIVVRDIAGAPLEDMNGEALAYEFTIEVKANDEEGEYCSAVVASAPVGLDMDYISFTTGAAGQTQIAERIIPNLLYVEGTEKCTASYRLEVEYGGVYKTLSQWREKIAMLFDQFSDVSPVAEVTFNELTAELHYKFTNKDMEVIAANYPMWADSFNFRVYAVIAGSDTQGATAANDALESSDF